MSLYKKQYNCCKFKETVAVPLLYYIYADEPLELYLHGDGIESTMSLSLPAIFTTIQDTVDKMETLTVV